MSTEGGTKAVVAAMTANAGIAATKFVAFAFTGSSSMLSEAIHSVADTANQGLLLLGGKRSTRVADVDHQFGYGRVRYVYAFVVAIVIFLLGGLFSLFEGFHKFQHPEELDQVWIAYLVLIVAICLEGWSFRTAFTEADKSRGQRSLLGFIKDARQPELPVVLLEDLGALLGLVFALIGVTAAHLTGDPRWDGVGAVAIGGLLVVIAVFLAFEMASMLVGESALPEVDEAIRRAFDSAGGIERLIYVKTLHTGPDEILVAAKVAVPETADGIEISRSINAVERKIREVVPEARYVFIEPDLDQG